MLVGQAPNDSVIRSELFLGLKNSVKWNFCIIIYNDLSDIYISTYIIFLEQISLTRNKLGMMVVKKAKYFTTRIFFNALIVTTKLKQKLVWGSSFTFRGLKKYMTMCRFIPNFPYHRMVIKLHLEFLMIICLSNEDTVKIVSVIYPWQKQMKSTRWWMKIIINV